MAVEIELKARLNDHLPVKERLSALGEYCRSYTKTDTYWLPALFNSGIPSGVRVRRENSVNADNAALDTILITYKTKEITNGIEVNDESEFTVSDADVFEELLRRLGLRPTYHKEKQGWAWLIASGAEALEAPILAELSSVAGLGWFLEIEIQAADSSRQIIDESRRRLLTLLSQLEIPPDQIESRPYTVMLKEAV
jgi:adenylate cyclase class 2